MLLIFGEGILLEIKLNAYTYEYFVELAKSEDSPLKELNYYLSEIGLVTAEIPPDELIFDKELNGFM